MVLVWCENRFSIWTFQAKSEFVMPPVLNLISMDCSISSYKFRSGILRAALLHYECYDAYPWDNYPDGVHCKIMLVVSTVYVKLEYSKYCDCLVKCSSVITYAFFFFVFPLFQCLPVHIINTCQFLSRRIRLSFFCLRICLVSLSLAALSNIFFPLMNFFTWLSWHDRSIFRKGELSSWSR